TTSVPGVDENLPEQDSRLDVVGMSANEIATPAFRLGVSSVDEEAEGFEPALILRRQPGAQGDRVPDQFGQGFVAAIGRPGRVGELVAREGKVGIGRDGSLEGS